MMLRVFETFAGIGAQHKAISNIGNNRFKVVGISEWDIYANISYAAIHHNEEFQEWLSRDIDEELMLQEILQKTWSKNGKEPCNESQIRRLDFIDIKRLYCAMKVNNSIGSVTEISGNDILERLGNIDMITYSFPCQDLSVAGSFHGFNQGMKKGDGTRSGLLWEIERIVKELKENKALPKYLLLENVVNMISSRHINEYKIWLKELKKLGYSTRTYKLDSSKYGLPQTRKRVYALSILDYQGEVDKDGSILDIKDPEEDELPDLRNFLRQDYTNQTFLKEALNSNPNRTPSRERMFNDNPKLSLQERKTARTITTKQDRHPNAGVIDLRGTIIGGDNRAMINNVICKANYRFLTPRECYLLMGFTDNDFDKVKEFNIRKEKLYQQAGNSIAVKTIEKIFMEVMEYETK